METTITLEQIKIAILVPCYNVENYLPYLFEGIHAQSILFDEIICYDDCSQDNSAEIAQSLGAKVIKGITNKGAAFARNRLIEATTCNWVHFHDADDLIDSSFVEEFKHSIQNSLNTQSNCYLSNMDVKRGIHKEIQSTVVYNSEEIEKDAIKYFLENNGFALIGCYPIDLLKKIGGFREDIRGNEDPDLHIRLAAVGAHFICLNKALVTNITREDSFSVQNWLHCMKDKLTCLEHYHLVLNPKYFEIIGEQAAKLSNYFYKENEVDLSNKALNLALRTKVRTIKGTLFSEYISKLFGVAFYIWLSRRRIDYNLSK
ncbi:glycosyltransferase family 2 protein [Pedobacter planticolens]|uniref:glycosyltransferase family 2 protein n=1 Tax=Pedobacter planticolens TaxID=2679964 RepID=UPI0016037E3E|nr:glycosyltransferase family A protein [Pedobacter planticolens]